MCHPNTVHQIEASPKTYTGQHSDQLRRYREWATEKCSKDNVQLVCVYLKTGSESASVLKKVEDQGFAVFTRPAFLDVLKAAPVKNHIFIDFHERLQFLDNEENEFPNKFIKDWKDADWRGFYQALEKLRTIINWCYVPNQLGGFWNMVLNWHEKGDCCPYMQIEQGPLCFKVGEIYENRSKIRDHYHKELIKHCAGKDEIRRPARFGCGKYMTIACVNRADWLGSDDSLVDIKKVVARLDYFENIYSEFLAKMQPESVPNTMDWIASS